MTGSRLRNIGWAAVLVVCTALYLALHLRVNAVKSQVRQAERQIVALEDQKLLLETEFETRVQPAAARNLERCGVRLQGARLPASSSKESASWRSSALRVPWVLRRRSGSPARIRRAMKAPACRPSFRP